MQVQYQGSNLYTCPHMPPPGHVWACVLFRGACVLGSRVLEGGMCGACVLFACFLLKSRKNFACGAHNPGGNPPDPPQSQNGHVYFEIPTPSTVSIHVARVVSYLGLVVSWIRGITAARIIRIRDHDEWPFIRLDQLRCTVQLLWCV